MLSVKMLITVFLKTVIFNSTIQKSIKVYKNIPTMKSIHDFRSTTNRQLRNWFSFQMTWNR